VLLDDFGHGTSVWAIRLLGERPDDPEPASMAKLSELARSDSSGLVRQFRASSL